MKNTVHLIGRAGDIPKVKEVKDDKSVATFSLATSDTYKDKVSGEKKEETTWHNIEIWGKNNVAKYITKGMLLSVEGSIHNSTYPKTFEGVKVTMSKSVIRASDIKFLEPKKDKA